jgi:hypothetical protein
VGFYIWQRESPPLTAVRRPFWTIVSRFVAISQDGCSFFGPRGREWLTQTLNLAIVAPMKTDDLTCCSIIGLIIIH